MASIDLKAEGSSLPKGAAKDIEEQAAVADALGEEQEAEQEAGAEPAAEPVPDEVPTADDGLDDEDDLDLDDEEDDDEDDEDFGGLDDFLFGPSARPGEPLTAGISEGPGPGVVRSRIDNPREFLKRLASELASQPNQYDDVVAFASRVARGE